MSSVTTINLLDLVDAIGEEETKNLLSDFSCSKNQEIEKYVQINALDFAKRKISMTHLVIDEQGRVAAMFALTHKAIEITGEGLSNTTRSKLRRFAELVYRMLLCIRFSYCPVWKRGCGRQFAHGRQPYGLRHGDSLLCTANGRRWRCLSGMREPAQTSTIL